MDTNCLNPMYYELMSVETDPDERLSLCISVQRLEHEHLRNIVGLIAHGQALNGRPFVKSSIGSTISQYHLDNLDPTTANVILAYIKLVTQQKFQGNGCVLTSDLLTSN